MLALAGAARALPPASRRRWLATTARACRVADVACMWPRRVRLPTLAVLAWQMASCGQPVAAKRWASLLMASLGGLWLLCRLGADGGYSASTSPICNR
ncbi:hypothetical protein LNQ03_08220 [Klebsiella pneumoniae subsp. pneumoniae]|nr:hypothetical protein [Klebsiella pneumoniae subsp. pneumoniae]